MPLSAQSTLAEVQSAYDDNASYLENGSIEQAHAFITACRFLIRRLPARVSKGGRQQGEETELNVRLLADQINEAKRFLVEATLRAQPPHVYSIQDYRM
jgi:hypothetical protein